VGIVSRSREGGGMSDDKKQKVINSVLLCADVPQGMGEDLTHFLASLETDPHGHYVPPAEVVEKPNKNSRLMFDFSGEVDTHIEYSEALSLFMESHKNFIEELLSLDQGLLLELSVQLEIDESLAVFDIKCPRIPRDLNEGHRFSFTYSVWHIAANDHVTASD
jgi:hypothetical protein